MLEILLDRRMADGHRHGKTKAGKTLTGAAFPSPKMSPVVPGKSSLRGEVWRAREA
jgi:hypothetical protein